jgi:proteic killer suppression protein
VIKSFLHKGLKEVFETGRSARVRADLVARCRRRLDVLHHATALTSVNIPGFDFHPLNTKPVRYSIHVNGPWCITFEWDRGDSWRVDLEQYH